MRHPRLTTGQVDAIRAAVAAGLSKREALAAAGATGAQLARATLPGGPLEGLRTGRRWRPPTADPTPAEIRARAAECRLRWTPERWLPEGLEDDLVEAGGRGRR